MLKIRGGVDLKELEKYRFTEYSESWDRCYNSNEIITTINKDTREIIDVDTDHGFFEMKNLGESTRINDLIKADLVEMVDD